MMSDPPTSVSQALFGARAPTPSFAVDPPPYTVSAAEDNQVEAVTARRASTRRPGAAVSKPPQKGRSARRKVNSFQDIIQKVKQLSGEEFPAVRPSAPSLPLLQDRSNGAPVLHSLPIEVLQEIIRSMYFPDIFAFALSCRSALHLVDLPHEKAVYLATLRRHINQKFHGRDIAQGDQFNRDFCDICLYRLPFGSFTISMTTASRMEPRICKSCQQYRAQAESYGMGDGLISNQLIRTPSSRRDVSGTAGSLWYRQAE